MSTVMNKKAKLEVTRKNAEALKAKKKAQRDTKSASVVTLKPGAKGKSIIAQAKKK